MSVTKRDIETNGLKRQHALFVTSFVKTLSPSEAAIAAGYSPQRARRTGHDLLKRPEIEAAIQAELAPRFEAVGIEQDPVLQELASLVFSRLTDFVNWRTDEDGRFVVTWRDSAEFTPAQQAAVKSLKVKPGKWGTAVSIEMHPKHAAIDTALAWLGRQGTEDALEGLREAFEAAATPVDGSAASAILRTSIEQAVAALRSRYIADGMEADSTAKLNELAMMLTEALEATQTEGDENNV